MTLGLSGHFSTFGLVFFVLKCLLGIDNGIVKNLQSPKPRNHIGVLIHQIWASTKIVPKALIEFSASD